MSVDVKENLLNVISSIRETENQCSRKEGSVKLIAVSKFHPIEEIISALDAGQLYFGENRVQEAVEKFSIIKKTHPETHLHIIGTLQTNKVKKAVEIAECIESVDRKQVLYEIEKQCAKINKTISVLLELHTGEESKSGFSDEKELSESLELFSSGVFPHIVANGFMTMAPFTEDESLIRKSFATLRETSERMKKNFPNLPLKELSMGMSSDYKIAIEEGSTMVRVGTAIFGPRNYSQS